MTSRKSESKNPMLKSEPVQPGPTTTKQLIGSSSIQHILINSSEFLRDFDPANSRRGQQKKKRDKPFMRSNNLYDEIGRIRQTKQDICDCFDDKCSGCHYPCSNCKSQKCGLKCRVNRKFTYEIIEYDGKDLVLRNPLVTTVHHRM